MINQLAYVFSFGPGDCRVIRLSADASARHREARNRRNRELSI
jgi:hypothetical protein